MSRGAENNNRFWNSSATGENKGTVGKLTTEQYKERTKLHAERMAFGKPTIQHICDHWWHKYQIRMTYSSEKEWATRNETTIIEAMNTMVDDGEIRLTITDQSLLNSVNVAGVETARVLRVLESRFVRMLNMLDLNNDPWAAIEVKYEDYKKMSKDKQAEIDIKLKTAENKNKMIMKFLPEMSVMIKDQKRILLDTISTTKEIFDDSKFKKVAIQNEVRKQIGSKLKEQSDKSGFDPLETQVSEEDRNKVLAESEPG